MLIPKPSTSRDKKYLEWIKTLQCCLPCCTRSTPQFDIIYHHLQRKGHGAKAKKCSDYRTLPLCHDHHLEIHAGRETFAKKYEIDFEILILAYNRLYQKLFPERRMKT